MKKFKSMVLGLVMGLTLCSAAQGMAGEVKELQVGKINQSMTSDTMVQYIIP